MRQENAHVQPPARPLLAMAAPPPQNLLPVPPPETEDRRGVEDSRAADQHLDLGCDKDSVSVLHNYRQARSLCFSYGECWGQGHQYTSMVQLHVVEELLDLLQAEDKSQHAQDLAKDEQLMSISKLATTG
jgi:hypothetical protein